MLLYLSHSVRKINSSYTTSLQQWVQSLFYQGSIVSLCLPFSMALHSLPPLTQSIHVMSLSFQVEYDLCVFLSSSQQFQSLHMRCRLDRETRKLAQTLLFFVDYILYNHTNTHEPPPHTHTQTYLKKPSLQHFFLFNSCTLTIYVSISNPTHISNMIK